MLLKVSRSQLHGYGCFTTRAVASGEIVALNRLLIFPPRETETLHGTRAKNYLFFVRPGAPESEWFHSALAMGPMSFCNHSTEPNCDFSVDEAAAEVTLVARRQLAEGEEVTINYGDYADDII